MLLIFHFVNIVIFKCILCIYSIDNCFDVIYGILPLVNPVITNQNSFKLSIFVKSHYSFICVSQVQSPFTFNYQIIIIFCSLHYLYVLANNILKVPAIAFTYHCQEVSVLNILLTWDKVLPNCCKIVLF